MKQTKIELAVGIFIIIGIICIGYLTIRLGKMEIIGNNNYPILASFSSVSGLKSGARVEIAGVKIGSVESISLDKERRMAIVKMKIQNSISLSDDVIASIKTSGLIGDKYITISPGGSERILKSGEKIIDTESSIDIEALISKYVFGKL